MSSVEQHNSAPAMDYRPALHHCYFWPSLGCSANATFRTVTRCTDCPSPSVAASQPDHLPNVPGRAPTLSSTTTTQFRTCSLLPKWAVDLYIHSTRADCARLLG